MSLRCPLFRLRVHTILLLYISVQAQAGWIWVEGEHPTESQMHRPPWWYDQVKRDQFSGGDFISNFDTEVFQPRDLLKPNEIAANESADDKDWFAFDPNTDPFATNSVIDLRFLNQKFAGEHGFIGIKDGQFVHTGNQTPVRFWAVNGPPRELSGADLARCARSLAKYGVNLVRVHGGYFDDNGNVAPARVKHAMEIVEAMKAEGIYTHFSIYFPLWLSPKPDNPVLKGYDGKTHPFAVLFFNPEFQAQYRQWWKALLTTPNPATGKPLVEEPAVAGVEMQNEDSLFFWTFAERNLPEPQLRLLEKLFGDWLTQKYGSPAAALSKWNGLKLKGDDPIEGRMAFRPLWNMFNEKTARDQDTARFLFELQQKFYLDTYRFLRKLGFKGVITASNWATASPEVFGPLEKLSYTCADFIDRHGYFSCNHQGDQAAWSVRTDHTYSDRSALRFDAEQPGKPKVFVHPSMDPHYNGQPSMISETTWNRPNRFRSEAPLYLATYGALQRSDAIVHFALDSFRWSVKPGYFMQPWTLMSPAMMGQFPAAALIYREGLVSVGSILAELTLNKSSLMALAGTPLPQDAALDELRLKDLPSVAELKRGGRLDPLIHYAGRVEVRFADSDSSIKVNELHPFIDHKNQQVHSSTGELTLDYGKGFLTINADRAQGVSGCLREAGRIQTKDLSILSDMELGHIVAVALDDRPLGSSSRILLQIMSEEKPTDFQTEPVAQGVKRIVSLGSDPWLVKEFRGTVRLKRPDAQQLKWTALDYNGYPETTTGNCSEIKLLPKTMYYLIGR